MTASPGEKRADSDDTTVPARSIPGTIGKLRTTGENRITEPLPAEVEPLVDEVNALLDHTERQAEEARMHAGNLAHALKTPLTVLTNAATARDPNLNEAVFRETRTMQRHVDHHLARASEFRKLAKTGQQYRFRYRYD